MKRTLLSIILGFTTIFAGAQTSVTPYTPSITAQGVTYALPRTELVISITLTKQHYQPGDFQAYAKPYLRLDNIPAQSYDLWQIDSLSVLPHGVPDPTKVYTIKLKKRTVAPLVSLTKNGVILGINAKVKDNITLPQAHVTRNNHKASNPRDYMTEDILLAGNSMKMAELTANEIFDIRDSRNQLMKGQADFMPKDGEQLKLMLARLDEQEEGLLQLYKGVTTTEQHTVILHFDPTQETKDQVLFRFSKHLGILEKDDLAGDPVYISIQDLHTVATAPTVDEKTAKRQAEEVRYNLPGTALINIFTPTNTYYNHKVQLAQLGRVEYLGGALFDKKATTSVTFFPTTGAVNKIDTNEDTE